MNKLARSTALALVFAIASFTRPATAQVQPEDAAYDVYARYRDDPAITTQQVEPGLWRAHLPLAMLRSEQGPIRLDGAEDTARMGFALAPQADVQSARLVLRHVSGRGQAKADPQLRLTVNDRFVGQLAGVTTNAAGVNEVVLDPSVLMTGFNTLGIDAVQRYTYDCQDPDAPELWTDIDTTRSYVEVTYTRHPFAGSLADLGALVTAGVGGVDHLGIVTGDGAMTPDRLRWGALSAQAVSNRLGYRLPDIAPLAPGALTTDAAGMDIVAVGTVAELGGLVPPEASALSGDEAWLSIAPSPADPTHFMIIASGLTPAGVEGAVRALAQDNFPLSDSDALLLSGADLPSGAVVARKRPIEAGAKYTFSNLGLADTSLFGKDHGSVELDFDLPADLRFRTAGEAVFSLDFAYGAGLRDDSVVNIVVNGEFQRAIRLTNPDGEVMPGYQIGIPTSALRPGHNTVAFEVELSTESEGLCSTRSMRHLAFVLKDTSTLTLPEADAYVELPNLALLAETGFPYTGLGADGFAIRAGDTQPETAAAVWTLAARLGQMHGTVFTGVDFGFGLDLGDQDTLVVGTRTALAGFMPASISFSGDAGTVDGGTFSRDFKSVDLGDNGLLIEGQSPSFAGRLVTVMTAETEQRLLSSAKSLVQPSHWSQLEGGAAVWRDNAATVVTQAPATRFAVGTMDPDERARMKSAQSPWRWILTIAGILFALASVLALIARYMRDRMNES
ncbi:cellulose biosynthesis cyclic di-GMP-binding regulatory protein BcsB [Hyphomonas johnsonii]|uniref:Cyclic di-GMP-binding protein n=1 Tax=Hyphomonas johnsonii MHS-2 TaxID=1280950 RepID=A0A059FNZ5_9PROT|nr:cellulose biosynthesis cyclic di-GMP-binding regulatory protein BcsB [Hyphomonas johnsonii]KCZ92246.1 celB protein [Hyphomonas johnsonii MHS-2]